MLYVFFFLLYFVHLVFPDKTFKNIFKTTKNDGNPLPWVLTILMEADGRVGNSCDPISPVGLSRSKEHRDIVMSGETA